MEEVRERWKVSNWEDPDGFILSMCFNFSDTDNDFGPDDLGMIVPVKRSLWLVQHKITRALCFGSFNVYKQYVVATSCCGIPTCTL